jgi:hypothetical protein
MGVVLRAEDEVLRRPVALKVMRPELAARPEARERFLREARAAAALAHEHVVPVYHVGEEGGTPFLVMPLLEGESLAARLRREGRLPVAEVLRIGREAAEGLAAAHERGLVHRDVKPGNLWLEGEPGKVKVLDFGLVWRVQEGVPLTQAGAVLGTPAYMAPEQVRGGAVDGRCDLFSLGVVLYETATGELPFQGEDALALLASLAADEPVPPCQLRPELPPALAALIVHLLAKRPADRPVSARAVADALRSLGTGTAPLPASAGEGSGVPTPAAADRVRRRGWWVAAVVGLLGLTGAVAVALYLSRPHGPAGAPEGPPPAAPPPLKGFIDVQIHEDGNPRRQNLRLNNFGALPLKPGDSFCIEAELNRPAYLYVLWIDPDGEVGPVYPWRPGHWEARPTQEQPVRRLRRPQALNKYYEIPKGTPGMETLVLLARATPLSPEVDLRAELGRLPRQTGRDLRAMVWFEDGAVVRDEPGRMPRFDEKDQDDPVLATQERIRARLGRHFTYTRAVSFANQGR